MASRAAPLAEAPGMRKVILPSWFPTREQEARAACRPVEEAPMRPFSDIEDRALLGAAGVHGAIKPLAIAMGRMPEELYRRRARLAELDRRKGR